MRHIQTIAALLFFGAAAACSVSLPTPIAKATPTPTPTPTVSVPTPIVESPAPIAAVFDPAHIAQVLGPAVAEVIVTTSRGGGLGSGFVISNSNGSSYLVTNNHVVSGASHVVVLMPDGRHFTATIQGTDPIQDIAVVKVADGTLPLAQFGDSTKLVVGQPVAAIGSPLGNQSTVTSGIISALHRSITAGSGGGTASEQLPDVLQTDAPINPGNSGGPLADADGKVIGVNTAGDTTSQGIGYAIPSLIAKRIAGDLMAGRKPGHPYVGVCFRTEDQQLASGGTFEGYGVQVISAQAGTPAAEAGIQSGDVIEQVDGIDLNNGQTLGGVIQLHSPGDKVSVTVLRAGATQTVSLTLGDRPAIPASC